MRVFILILITKMKLKKINKILNDQNLKMT